MVKRKRQTIQWPKEKDRQYNDQKKKTDNTMTKRKRTNRQTIKWPKEKGRKDRQYNGQKKKTDNIMAKRKRANRQTIQWSKELKTDNTMVKRKRQTIQWSKEKGQIDRQYNGQKN